MNISFENVDPTWLFALLLGGNVAGFAWLKRDTKQVRQVNDAVNHIAPGTPTLSERMDNANKTIEFVQVQQATHKRETAERFDKMEAKQNEIRGMVADTQDDVSSIRESIDKRKPQRGEHG